MTQFVKYCCTVEKLIVLKPVHRGGDLFARLREWLDNLKVTNLLKFHHNFEPYYSS
jgi:hypothetical protein